MTSEFDWVKLISSEGAEFFLEKRVATAGSVTMRAMLDGPTIIIPFYPL